MQTEKIKLYKVRDFGDKFNATFDFAKQNFKPMFKFMTYFLLPMSLILGLLMSGMTTAMIAMGNGTAANSMSDGLLARYGGMLIIIYAAVIVVATLVYSFVQVYEQRDGGLQDLRWADLKAFFKRNCKRLILLFIISLLLGFAAMMVIVLLAVVSLWTLALTIPLFIVGLLPLCYWPSIYLLEGKKLWPAFIRCYHLGMPTWGGIFVITLVMYLLVQVVTMVFAIPYYIVIGVTAFMGIDGSIGGFGAVALQFLSFLSTTLLYFASLTLSSLTILALIYQYSHAAEKIDGMSVDRRINEFDTF